MIFLLFAGHRLLGGNSEYHSHKTEQILHSKVIECDIWKLINVKSDMRLNWIKRHTHTFPADKGLCSSKWCRILRITYGKESLKTSIIEQNKTKQCKYHSGTISADQRGNPNPYPGYSLLKAGETKNYGRKIFYTAMLIKRAYPAFQELL